MLKRVVAAVVIATAGVAFASPAQDLFDQASFQLGFYYSGPAKNPGFRALRQQYQPKLDAACAGDKNCGYDKATPIIKEMIASLGDGFTTYMTEAEATDSDRRVAGLGPLEPRLGLVTAPFAGKGLVVIDAFEGEPASTAGVKRGDVIKSVNGNPASEAALAGSGDLKLTIERKGAQSELTVKPAVAKSSQFVSVDTLPQSVYYIRIPDFYRSSQNSSVGSRFAQLVATAARNNQKGIIVDVRDSYSGLDTEALAAASALTDGLSFTYKTRFPNSDQHFLVKSQKIYLQQRGQEQPIDQLAAAPNTKIPVVVLVNARTFNSAEMFAYWLQKAGRAKIIGEKTAGQLNISGGYSSDWQLLNDDFINLTSIRLYNDDGSLLPDRVTPDVEVADDLAALADGRDPALDKALELLGAR